MLVIFRRLFMVLVPAALLTVYLVAAAGLFENF